MGEFLKVGPRIKPVNLSCKHVSRYGSDPTGGSQQSGKQRGPGIGLEVGVGVKPFTGFSFVGSHGPPW
jgi:hypothetical protein